MTRIFLRILLADGRRVVVRDPGKWSDLQEEVREGTYIDLPPVRLTEIRQQATTVQVVADGGGQVVLAEFDSLEDWERRGRGLHQTPFWLPGWLVCRLDEWRREERISQQELITELLIAALRMRVRGAEGAVSPLFLRLYLREGWEGGGGKRRVFVTHSPPGQPWSYIQEEIEPGKYRDIPADDPMADLARLADVVEQVEVMTTHGAWPIGLAIFSARVWREKCWGVRVISPRLPCWLVRRLDEIRQTNGGRSRRHIVEEWLIMGLMHRALADDRDSAPWGG